MMDPSRREQRAWYVYDWANSAFSTTVVSLFFGPYLTRLAESAAGSDGQVHVLGIGVQYQALWPYLVSLSVLTQVLAFPLFGALTDFSRRKKEMLAACAFTGAAANCGMYWLVGDRYLLGCALFLVANLAYGASIVVYNSFLPEIAGPAQRDAVSSNGWALGYAGGGLLLALNMALYLGRGALGVPEGFAVRISLASAGMWWGLFTAIPLLGLKNRNHTRGLSPGMGYFRTGFLQLRRTFSRARRLPQTLWFLAAFLIYNDGIQTVLTLAAQFGQEELGLPMAALTASILLAQVFGIPGAIAFKHIAALIGNKNSVMAALVVWSLILLYAYLGVHSAAGFYGLASMVGLVMGGSQALSRSIFSFLIPDGEEAEYFSLYEVTDKGSSWLGPFVLARVLEVTGSFRKGILSVIVFFVVGLVLLAKVDVSRGATDAGNAPPR